MPARIWPRNSAVRHIHTGKLTKCLFRSLPAIAVLFGGLVPCILAQTPTPVTVPTWRYDLTHTGQNTSETALTPANVNVNTFGKLFSIPVDGYVYSQPLYVQGLTMGDGRVHNVVFIATEHDSVYAFDADSNTGANANPIWHVTLLDAAHGAGSGATTVPNTDVNTDDIFPEIGITGTAVINPATNTMYVVGKTKENGVYFQRLHAINILTGAEQANSPTIIQATVSGTGDGSTSGRLPFDSLWENQRTALDYYNGHVYFGFSAHGDNGPYHGWIFAYDATTLAQTAAVCLSANGVGNGVWMSGAGMPIDTAGAAPRLLLTTGNGSYVSYPPFNLSSEFGDSTTAFDLSNGGLTATDAFTPFNQANLSQNDFDQGSGGILVLPDQSGPHPHILVQVGKEGRILVLNRDNLGGFAGGGTSNTNALQDIPQAIAGLWSTPAYWNGSVYFWGSGDVPKMFSVNNGVLSTTPSSKSTIPSDFPGASFVISSNGTQNGVAWAVRTDQFATYKPQVLYAFDATNLANVLYESDTNTARDGAGGAMKFAIPVVTNGKVYVASETRLDVYGLIGSQSVAAAPVITPNGGTFATAQSVTLSSTTPSAHIYYTLDGSLPTTGSTLYSSPISISSNKTLHAIATATGYTQSAESSATFTFSQQTPAVSFSPAAGTYTSTQNVTLSDTDTSAAIYYTTNGTQPSVSSTRYTAPIPVAASVTINAIAIDPSLQNSAVTSAAYVIQAGGTPAINFGSGFASAAGLTLNGTPTVTSNTLQLTHGAAWDTGSAFWSQPMGVQAFTTDFNFQLLNAKADGFTFTIQNAAVNALGPGGSGLGYGASQPGGTGGIARSVAVKFDIYNNDGEGSDSTGFYTNGASPTTPATDMTASGVTLNNGDVFHAHLTYDGTTLTLVVTDTVTSASFTTKSAINIPSIVGANTAYVGFTAGAGDLSANQNILNWTYTPSGQTQTTAAPVFSPQAGSYSTTQNVTLSSATQGAVIYYTTNNTTPTTASPVYSSAIAVGAGTTTIEAIAVANGSQSAVSTAQYVVQLPITATPTFSPAAGTYAAAQNVTLSSSTTGAVIYYTTNGTTPTTGSVVYTAPIYVATTETLEAIAVAPNSQTSSTATAAYTIQSGTPAVNFGSGFSSAAGLTLNGTPAVTGNLLRLTNGANWEAGSAFWNQPLSIQAFTTDFNFQLVNAQADGFTFTIQNTGVTAIGPDGSGLGYGAAQPGGTGGIGRSVAVKFDIYSNDGEGTDSTGFYTNGASPTTPATDMSASGVTLTNGHVFHAHITYDGTNLTLLLTDTTTSASFTKTSAINIPSIVGANTAYVGFTAGTGGLGATQNIVNWTYTPSGQTQTTAAPVFSPQAGSYSTTQNVALSSATPGAVIYYTTNNTTPTTASSVYSSAIAVGAGTTTIKAIAVANGSQSGVSTAQYVVQQAVTAPPTFSPAAGTYTTAQNVALADTTPGAVIYYTANGSTPTTASAVYTSPIQVAATETLKAIAAAPSSQISSTATAAYTIQPATLVINFANGFSSTAGLTLNGTASTGGSVFWNQPVAVQAFTTDFSFQLLNPNANGFTFTIQNTGLNALGPMGSGLGYGAAQPGGTGGIGHSVAVKFDIHNSNGEGTDSTGFYTNGASPTTPATDMTASGVTLNNGHVFHAHITYNGTYLTLLLTDTSTSASFTKTSAINIPSIVGANTAYVGFTADTGGSSTSANILSWTVTNP